MSRFSGNGSTCRYLEATGSTDDDAPDAEEGDDKAVANAVQPRIFLAADTPEVRAWTPAPLEAFQQYRAHPPIKSGEGMR